MQYRAPANCALAPAPHSPRAFTRATSIAVHRRSHGDIPRGVPLHPSKYRKTTSSTTRDVRSAARSHASTSSNNTRDYKPTPSPDPEVLPLRRRARRPCRRLSRPDRLGQIATHLGRGRPRDRHRRSHCRGDVSGGRARSTRQHDAHELITVPRSFCAYPFHLRRVIRSRRITLLL